MEPKSTNGEVTELRRENARLRGDLLTLAFRIAHDLRRPLGGIIYPSEALRTYLTTAEPSRVPLLDSVLGSTDDLARLIQRVSFVLRATAKARPLQPLNMEAPVTRALGKLDVAIGECGAAVTQPDSWPDVLGAGEWLEVIWSNLLANALEHAGPRPRVEIGWRKERRGMRFWVADNGPGLPRERLKEIFTPFELLHTSDIGQGLGLSIVQRLVELQNGVCGYARAPRQGACFYFILPAHLPLQNA